MEFEIRLRNELKKKANQDYMYTDVTAGAKSVERRFVEELDCADEVMIYAKVPRGFSIPTPVGIYSPDWAILFNEGEVKHTYFVAKPRTDWKAYSCAQLNGTRSIARRSRSQPCPMAV